MMNVQGRKKHMTSAQIIIFGFMVVIFMGALLLMLPISIGVCETPQAA